MPPHQPRSRLNPGQQSARFGDEFRDLAVTTEAEAIEPALQEFVSGGDGDDPMVVVNMPLVATVSRRVVGIGMERWQRTGNADALLAARVEATRDVLALIAAPLLGDVLFRGHAGTFKASSNLDPTHSVYAGGIASFSSALVIQSIPIASAAAPTLQFPPPLTWT